MIHRVLIPYCPEWWWMPKLIFFLSKYNSSACHWPNVLIITQLTVCAVVDTTQRLFWLRKTQDSREPLHNESEVSHDFGISSGNGKHSWKNETRAGPQGHSCKGTGVSSTLNQTFLTVTALYTPSHPENGSLAPLKPYRVLKWKLRRICSVPKTLPNSNASSFVPQPKDFQKLQTGRTQGKNPNVVHFLFWAWN